MLVTISFLFMGQLGRLRGKIVVIKHGIDTERFKNATRRDFRKEFGLSDNDFLIGFLGRFMSPKGFRYLIDAIDLLKNQKGLLKNPLVLAIGGGGFLNREVRDIKRRGLDKYFIFLPFMADISSALKGLDVVVMPSIWEASPLLPLETIAAGVPLIATDCIGLREVVKDTPARVVQHANARDLAKAIFEDLKNPRTNESAQFMEIAAERFSAKAEADMIENMISKLIDKANTPNSIENHIEN